MARRYAVLDVFTNSALSGNPLAVVLDSEGLSQTQMQSIAAEFNLSETVFVLPMENPAQPVRVRIFTPQSELPFAGHPTIGTAILLAQERFGDLDNEQDAVIALEQKIGVVRCGVVLKPNAAGFAEFDVPKLSNEVPFEADKEAIAAALELEPMEIGFENHKPTMYEAGVPFAFVPVRDIGVLSQAKPNIELWEDAFGDGDHNNAYIYCRETRLTESGFHARMFAPGIGVTEDPATGSAAAAFAGVIKDFDDLPNGTHFIQIEQGYLMGRPSLIDLEIDIDGSALHAVRIGGQAVILARGELFI
ncbi:MAG: PhzF family phenazine biosynthesis protein [Stappiaceae bacterium]